MAYLFDGGFTRSLYSLKETGKILANGVKELVEDFLSGFNGHGWKIWKTNEGKIKAEFDELLIRGQFTIFELIISQIRAIRGSQAITQGNSKIKSVSTYNSGGIGYYRLTIEEEVNSIMEYDFIRCQRGGKMYHVGVSGVGSNYIDVKMSEFSSGTNGVVTNPPEAGDEVVQFGNSSRDAKYAKRHSALYMHVDNGEPQIDYMTNIYSKDWSNVVTTRLGGDLPGTNGQRGFYCVNGKIMSVDESGNIVNEINPDGSGQFARGQFSWSKDGSPRFSGSIYVKIDENNVWEVNEAAVNIIGNKNGKRIEISPISQDIKIFNENDINTTIFNGTTKNSLDDIFGTETISIVKKNIPYSKSYTEVDEVHLVEFSNEFRNTTSANLEYNIAGSIEDTSSDSRIEITLLVYSYSSPLQQNLIGQTLLFFKQEVNSVGVGSFAKSSNIILQPGYHVIKGLFRGRSYMPGLGVAKISLTTLNCSLKPLSYISEYFANGFALGTSKINLFSAINKNNQMEIIARNNNAGIEVGPRSLNTHHNGKPGIPSSTIFKARVKGLTSGPLYGYKAVGYDGNIPIFSRDSAGVYNFTFPSSWVKMTTDDYIVNAFIANYSSLESIANNIKVFVYNSSIVVQTFNGTTLVDTSFHVEMKWLSN